MKNHEGKDLKNRILGSGKSVADVATVLGMTRQNLNVHLAKEILGEDFRRLFQEKQNEVFQMENKMSNEELKTDTPMQAIISLVENNTRLTTSIEALVNTNSLLSSKVIEGLRSKNPVASDAIQRDFLESLISYGNGKWWQSKKEARRILNNLLHGNLAKTA